MLALSNISHSYGTKQIFKNISCTLPRGKVLAIVGKSGCGKSSLLRILAGIEQPQSGDVHFNGATIRGVSGSASFMQQEDLLLPYLKIVDNVALPLRIQNVQKKPAREKALQMLAQFQLADVAYSYPLQLSGGMRQRIALMRSCIASTELLLLDEPFSKLDAITKEECEQWSRSVWESFGSTVVLVTHDIAEAITIAHFIAVLGGNPSSFRLFENTQSFVSRAHRIHDTTPLIKNSEVPHAAKKHIISLLQ